MASTHPWIGITLDPLDTLFFRDGRPFDAANRVQSGWPTPQTLAGALRTALLARSGFQFHAFRPPRTGPLEDALLDAQAKRWIVESEFRGPFLALVDRDNHVEPLLQLPAVLTPSKVEGKWSWAKPIDASRQLSVGVTGWQDADGLLPLYRSIEPDPKADRPLLTLAGVKQFLNGEYPDEQTCHALGDLYGHDHRVGIAINPESLTTAEGQLYAISLLALQARHLRHDGRRLCLYAEMKPGRELDCSPESLINRTAIPFGGEGRHVEASTVKVVSWPVPIQDQTASVWYLASPTFLPRRASGRPLPSSAGLQAAASGPGMAVSGWDIARGGPRATRFAVPAGAVYYMNGPGAAADFVDQQQPDALNLQREGWGFALQGVWKKEEQ